MKLQHRILSAVMVAVVSAGAMLPAAKMTAGAAVQQEQIAETAPEIAASGSNAVGIVLAESINKEAEKLQHAEGCSVFSIQPAQSSATVYFSAPQDCKLVVGVYTDAYADGCEKMAASAVKDVRAGDTSAEVNFPGFYIPQYYVLKAYLIGSSGNLLSEEYVDQTHTKDIQDLMQSDIHCYEGYEVLNLDDQDDTNFVVYKKDVKVLHTSENENILTAKDEEGGVLTIQNIGTELKEGDVVSVQDEEGEVTVFSVQSAETKDGLTTVRTDTTMKPSDAFAYMKVEVTPEDVAEHIEPDETAPSENHPAQPFPMQNKDDETVPDAEDNEGWSFEAKQVIETEMTGDPIQIPGFEFNISGSFRLESDLKGMVSFDYYSTESRTSSSFYFECEVAYDLTAEAKAELYIPIYDIGLKVFGVNLDIGIFMKLGLYASVTGNVNFKLIYDSTGFHPDSKVDLQAKGEYYFGVAVKLECKLFGNGVEGEVGVGVRTAVEPTEPHPGCSACVAFSVSAEANYELKTAITILGLESTFGISGTASHKLFDVYYSNVFGFRNGRCPNRFISGRRPSVSDPTGSTPVIIDDGLTESQREYLVFVGNGGGYSASVKPEHVDDIESIEIPAEYMGEPVTMIGTGFIEGNFGGGFDTDSGWYHVQWTKSGIRTGGSGFEGCKNLRSVKLPETISAIAAFAFAGCTSLESINLPDSVVSIEQGAFACCRNLHLNSLPPNIHEIDDNAFLDCDKAFPQLFFPSSLQKMGSGVFANCDGIHSVCIGFRAIPNQMFAYCHNLSTVVIEEPTLSIRKDAFYKCDHLTKVVLPDSLRVIGENAFQHASQLMWIRLPDNLHRIGQRAFEWTSLKEFQIPPQLKRINYKLLYADSMLMSVVLPETIEYIDFSAFDAASSMISITVLNPSAVFAELSLVDGQIPDSYYPAKKTIRGYSGSTAEEFCKKYGFRFLALDPPPADTTVTTSGPTAGTTTTAPGSGPQQEPPLTKTFEHLEPDTLYNFYDLLGTEFTAENLLFLFQGMSDSDGTLTIWYRPKADDTGAEKIVRKYETETKVKPTVFGAGPGDLNGDNQIDVSDAVLLTRLCVEDPDVRISREGILNADVNNSGQPDSDDTILILKYIAHLIDSLG